MAISIFELPRPPDHGLCKTVIWEKLIQKLLLNQKCMGYLVRAYYSISPTRYYKDDLCWRADLKSKTTEDIISNRSFMEVLVLNHYVLVKKDPYKAIRQAYLVGTNTKSKPFEGEAETPESPHTVAPPTCHVEESEGSGTSDARSTSSDSTAPLSSDHPLTHTTHVLVPSLRRTVRMAVRIPPAMSPGLSVSIAEVAAMFDSTFCKRFRSSYDSSPSPTFPVSKSMGVDSLGLGGDEDVPEGQQRATPVMQTITLPSPEWTSGLFPISPAPSTIPLPISSPMISLTVPSPVATPATVETEGFLTKMGAQVEMQGGLICDHTIRLGELSLALFERYDRDIGELFTRLGAVRHEIFSQGYQFRSLEHKQERTAVQAALQQELQEMRGRVTALE
nr:hypothetical protein [Tanacetum cinerariifolium]